MKKLIVGLVVVASLFVYAAPALAHGTSWLGSGSGVKVGSGNVWGRGEYYVDTGHDFISVTVTLYRRNGSITSGGWEATGSRCAVAYTDFRKQAICASPPVAFNCNKDYQANVYGYVSSTNPHLVINRNFTRNNTC
jgi:hypothetical protein